MNPEELRTRIEELRNEFGELLDEDALRRIALDERGLLMLNEKSIAELKDREEASLEVRVNRIMAPRDFKKRDGGTGRVRNIDVEDNTGSCRVVLWDDDVDLPEKLNLSEGSKMKLINCYVKFTDFGVDVSRGRKGRIEIV